MFDKFDTDDVSNKTMGDNWRQRNFCSRGWKSDIFPTSYLGRLEMGVAESRKFEIRGNLRPIVSGFGPSCAPTCDSEFKEAAVRDKCSMEERLAWEIWEAKGTFNVKKIKISEHLGQWKQKWNMVIWILGTGWCAQCWKGRAEGLGLSYSLLCPLYV